MRGDANRIALRHTGASLRIGISGILKPCAHLLVLGGQLAPCFSRMRQAQFSVLVFLAVFQRGQIVLQFSKACIQGRQFAVAVIQRPRRGLLRLLCVFELTHQPGAIVPGLLCRLVFGLRPRQPFGTRLNLSAPRGHTLDGGLCRFNTLLGFLQHAIVPISQQIGLPLLQAVHCIFVCFQFLSLVV